jgi:aminopeptidase N
MVAYAKGSVFLSQLGYVIGKENLEKTLKRYFDEWAFKHPTPNDFIRVAEKVSGLELDWYLMDFMQTTNTIDYGIKNVEARKDATVVTLERIGVMGMPVDLDITYVDGSQEQFYIPLQMMRGEKPEEYNGTKRTTAKDWAWAHPTYELSIPSDKKVKSMMIDASKRMADINDENNTYGIE